MLYSEFARPYPNELSAQEIHAGDHSKYIQTAQLWSYKFGRMLHAGLNQTPTDDALTDSEAAAYLDWLNVGRPTMHARIPSDDADTLARVLTETNFHSLNNHMASMWVPVMEGAWPSESARRSCIGEMRTGLAIEGMEMLAMRERIVKLLGSTVLFETRIKPLINAFNGAAQEFDAALVLLDIAQSHPSIAIVPAPLQFERGPVRQYNVDFIVADYVEKRAIGLQVKSSVSTETADSYNKDYVVLIDGNVDFDNVKAVRTKKTSSAQHITPWPGMIAARRIQDIPTHNRPDRQRLLRCKLFARGLLGNTKVNYQLAAERVGKRVLEKLYASA